MLKYIIHKISNTMRRQGISSVTKKSYKRMKGFYLGKSLVGKNDNNNWLNLSNRYDGERVFLIGNGPSLNKTPLYYLKNEYTMCFNRFYIINERINWTPSFFLTVDDLVLSDIINDLDSIVPETIYSFFPDVHFRGEKFIDKIPQHDKIYWLRQKFGQGFSTKLPYIYPGGSVIYEGLQILHYLGFKKIYLVGVDMNYRIHDNVKYINDKDIEIISQDDDDPNHFDPRYFGKNRKYHQPEEFVIHNIIKNINFASKKLKELDVEILNVGYDSHLECFQKREFENILNISDCMKEQLFNECLTSNMAGINSYKKFEQKYSKIEKYSDWDKENSFYSNLEIGIKIINDVIFTHIPIGPFRNNYYFVKRKKVDFKI